MAKGKILAVVLVGAFVLANAVTPFTQVFASNRGEAPKCGPDRMVQQMADDFGFNKEELEKYLQPGVNPHDFMHAAMLAKISGKPLSDVLAAKTLANTWRDVEQSLGVTKEQMHAFHQNLIATKMETALSLPKETVVTLLDQGYHPHDIAMSSLLSNEAQKPITEVLAMKKINNRWSDVAQSLNISADTLHQDMEKLHSLMPGPMAPHFHRPPMPDGAPGMHGGPAGE